PGARVWLSGCQFNDWYQPWSSRGGGGVVLQGAACDLLVTGCLFRNVGPSGTVPAAQRSRAIMVDDSGGDHYGMVGGAFATGHIVIRNCGFEAGPGTDNLSILIRVGKLGGPGLAAKSFTLTGSALYGENMQLQLGDIPTGKTKIAGCNTEALSDLAEMIGIDTTHQAKIPLANRVSNVSEGLLR